MNNNEYVLSYTEKNTEGKKYFFTDIDIPVMEIYATSKEEANEIIQEFMDKIAPIMEDKIHWDNADWEIQESRYPTEVLSEAI